MRISRVVWSQRQNSVRGELDDFNTSQQKKNVRMHAAACDVRSVMFKCQFSKLFKQTGLPARHNGQVLSGSDHFPQAGCVANKLVPTLAYRTNHYHAVTVTTFEKGRLREYCK